MTRRWLKIFNYLYPRPGRACSGLSPACTCVDRGMLVLIRRWSLAAAAPILGSSIQPRLSCRIGCSTCHADVGPLRCAYWIKILILITSIRRKAKACEMRGKRDNYRKRNQEPGTPEDIGKLIYGIDIKKLMCLTRRLDSYQCLRSR